MTQLYDVLCEIYLVVRNCIVLLSGIHVHLNRFAPYTCFVENCLSTRDCPLSPWSINSEENVLRCSSCWISLICSKYARMPRGIGPPSLEGFWPENSTEPTTPSVFTIPKHSKQVQMIQSLYFLNIPTMSKWF